MTPLREYRVIVPDTKNNHAWDSPHIDLPHLRDFMKYKLQYEDVIVTEVPQGKVSDQFIEMLSTFGLHRPADKETGPWYRGECHPNCKACDMINAIRSQAATERGEPHAKS